MSLLVEKNNKIASETILKVENLIKDIDNKYNLIQNDINEKEKFLNYQTEENVSNIKIIEQKRKSLKIVQKSAMPLLLIFIAGCVYYFFVNKSNYDFSASSFFIKAGITYLVLWFLGAILEKTMVKKFNNRVQSYNIDINTESKKKVELLNLKEELIQILDDKNNSESHLAALIKAKKFQTDYQVYKINPDLDKIIADNQSKITNEHLQNIIRLRSYIDKRQEIYLASLSSFENAIKYSETEDEVESIISYINQNESTLVKSYELSKKMIEFYSENNMVAFFKIYNGFEEIGLFSNAAEKKLIKSMDELNENIGTGFSNLITKISDLDNSLSYSLGSIENSIDSLDK